MPRLHVIRPGDGPETIEAWRAAVSRTDGPTALVLSRQDVPWIDRTHFAAADGLHRGAYVLAEAERDGAPAQPELILLATGSELSVALDARAQLQDGGLAVRLVSMPCCELFADQDQAYRDEVLPPAVTARLAVEAASPFGWREWVGSAGDVVGVDHFAISADGAEVLERFGFTAANVATRARAVLDRATRADAPNRT
jgi:transketolase